MLEKILKFLFVIIIIFFVIILIIVIYNIIQINIQHKSYPNILGFTFFEVATGSMEPTIDAGDVVIVKLTKEVEINDIIVYNENNNFITHRLIRNKENDYITKGDANNIEDNPIKENDILGKVVLTIPKVGILKKAILSPEVIMLIMSLIVLTIGLKIFRIKSR